MKPRKGENRIPPGWWATIMVVTAVAGIVFSWALYNRSFTTYAPITLTAERSGLMLEPGSVVKMRGVQVGRVVSVSGGKQPVSLKLEINPGQLKYIPANVHAQITASTAFGPKYVEFVLPDKPNPQRLSGGAVLVSGNVSTEVNTVFQNLVGLLHQIDPAKLNSVLATLADGLRGRGQPIGEATTDATQVLATLNERSDTIGADFRSFAGFSDTYSAAAQNLLATLDAISTTSVTLTEHSKAVDALLLNVIGLSRSGTDLIGPNKDNLVNAINTAEPTTNLLLQYSPEYTCLLVGSKWFLDHGGYAGAANGRSQVVDAALLLGNDPYMYPDNLPIVAAKGGPGGKPGCGSLPDASKNFPVRQLVTNTGWGTGMDIRDNIGLGHPCFANYFPETRAVPQPATYRCVGPPSPGLVVPETGPLPFAGPPPP